LLFNFPVGLEYPTPVAGGAIRYLPAIVLTHTIVFTGLWWLGTASYRLYSGAMSMLVIVPINVFISLLAVRSLVPFSCGELAGAIRKSTVLLGLSAAGPAITLIGAGWRADVSMQTALVAVILAPLAGSADCDLVGTRSGRMCSAREMACSKLQLPRGCWLPGCGFPGERR
jgi:hypothetical protein